MRAWRRSRASGSIGKDMAERVATRPDGNHPNVHSAMVCLGWRVATRSSIRSLLVSRGAPLAKGARRQPRGSGRPRAWGPRFCTAEAVQNLGAFPPGRTEKRRSRPISRVLSWTVILLGAASPRRSSNLPGSGAGHAIGSLFGLAPGGVCRAGPLPDSRCALTAPFHPCRLLGRNVGGIFLLHFPSARAAQALPGTLPCGARTFLGILSDDATAWPTPPRALSHAAAVRARRAPRTITARTGIPRRPPPARPARRAT